jgi:hypothetical protein
MIKIAEAQTSTAGTNSTPDTMMPKATDDRTAGSANHLGKVRI